MGRGVVLLYWSVAAQVDIVVLKKRTVNYCRCPPQQVKAALEHAQNRILSLANEFIYRFMND